MFDTLNKSYMSGHIGGAIILMLNDASSNRVLWKMTLRHDGGTGSIPLHELRNYCDNAMSDLAWILHNKCPDHITIKLFIKPHSQAYLSHNNKEYVIRQIPRYIDMLDPQPMDDLRLRNELFIRKIRYIMYTSCKNDVKVNIQVYLKIVKSISFENNRIQKDDHTLELVFEQKFRT
jgi:hypothetical protein